jgi:hypothetical protein
MKWPFSFKKTPHNDNQGLIDRYKQVRAASRGLNLTLAKQLPKAAVPECGKKLGIVKAGTLILNNDDEIAIVYDYCLYHYRRGGKNTIERYLEHSAPAAESAEMAILSAMLASYYSVFKVLDIHPKQGASLQDRLSNTIINLLDISLSETGVAGLDVAGRILPFADFNMSSGTLIPLPAAVFEEKITPIARKFLKASEPGHRPVLSSGQEAAFTAEIIRVSLHAGGEDNVFYTDIEH